MKLKFTFILLTLLLSSCSGVPFLSPKPTATPSPTYLPTATSTPLPTQTLTPEPTLTITPTIDSTCNRDSVVNKLDEIIPYQTFTLTYEFTTDNLHLLIFWIVDPDLNPLAKAAELESNYDLAVQHAVTLALKLMQTDACVSSMFDAINPVVVDRNYNGWFSGLIYIKDLQTLQGSGDQSQQAALNVVASGTAWKRPSVPEVQSIPTTSCSWDEVRGYVSRHFYQSPLNIYMLVSDPNGITFTVQYATTMNDDYRGDAFTTFLNTAHEIGCLEPPVDDVAVIIVDTDRSVKDIEKVPIQQK